MSSNTRTNAARLTALEETVTGLADGQARIIAILEAKAGHAKPAARKSTRKPKVEAPKARKAGARKTPNRKPVKNGVVEGARCLTKGNRPQFIADHDWALTGMSVNALVTAVLVDGQPLTGSWAIGPGYAEKVTGKATPVVSASVKATKKGKKTARKVAAKVEVDAPAKAADAPRRADGTITPRSEWALREKLAESGKFDRFEIDKIVAASV